VTAGFDGFDEEGGGGRVFDGATGRLMTPEELRAEVERREMERRDFFNRLNGLIFEELPVEAVDTVRRLFSDVAECPDPRSRANYLEGLLVGAVESRRRLAGPRVDDLGYVAPHGFVPAEGGWCGFPGCGLPQQAKPHRG
jgi:hypothetical protein